MLNIKLDNSFFLFDQPIKKIIHQINYHTKKIKGRGKGSINIKVFLFTLINLNYFYSCDCKYGQLG